MSNDINNVSLVGRLTRDAELKYTNSGTPVANFSIAVNEAIKQQDGTYADSANFFEIQYWGRPAEGINPYLTKGRQIALQGKLKQQTWTDNTTGQNRSKVFVTAFTIQLLAAPNNQPTNNYQSNQSAPIQQQFSSSGFPGPEQFDDDIPF